jgi:predicted RNA binding protein YcfA (HicA-like mRNA interferase family)
MDSSKLIRILRQHGWVEVRCEGSHVTLKHPNNPKLCTVPHPKQDLPIGTIKQILKNAEIE